jgi:hypothetical protein
MTVERATVPMEVLDAGEVEATPAHQVSGGGGGRITASGAFQPHYATRMAAQGDVGSGAAGACSGGQDQHKNAHMGCAEDEYISE